MKNIWIVLAHRSKAEIYDWTGVGAQPVLIKTMNCEDARLKTKAFRDDAKGRLFEHFSMHRHSTGQRHSENKDLMHDFTRSIANFLDKERGRGQFAGLVLLAAPKVLGELRSQISDETSKLVIESLSTNPQGFGEKDVARLSQETLRPKAQQVFLGVG